MSASALRDNILDDFNSNDSQIHNVYSICSKFDITHDDLRYIIAAEINYWENELSDCVDMCQWADVKGYADSLERANIEFNLAGRRR